MYTGLLSLLLYQSSGFLKAPDQSGQHSCACPSTVMQGIGLGPPVKYSKTNVTSWENCRDLCCKDPICIAWTLMKTKKLCLLRDKLGKRVRANPDQISGKVSIFILPSPNRSETLLFYVGILSAPQNLARVNNAIPLCALVWNTTGLRLREDRPIYDLHCIALT